MTPPDKCPVCLNLHLDPAKPATISRGRSGLRVDCPICGNFNIESEAWDDFLNPDFPVGKKLTTTDRAHLSHAVKTWMISGQSGCPNLNSDFLEHFVKNGCLGLTPGEQAVKAIDFVGSIVQKTGERLETLPRDFYAIIGAANPVMAVELAFELMEKGLLSGIRVGPGTLSPEFLEANLTLDGWERYEAEKRGEFSGNYGFIAMQFGDSTLDPFVENTVKPAVKDGIGYDLVDMRNVARAGIIDNIMRTQIRDAAFVIVDLTHDNSGAYWEAGYAEGLGKPVIYICEKVKFNDAKTHFDTNHCTTVLWAEGRNEEFCQELIATLRRSLNLFAGT